MTSGVHSRHRRLAHERSLTEILSLSDWWRFVPETLALLALIWLVGLWLNGGLSPPGNMPHPFWIPVLLISSQYGIMGGLFATLAATALFFLSELPAQSATQDFYAYAGVVAVQPCAWFATTLVLGGLRTLHIHHHRQLLDQFEQTSLEAEDLADGLERAAQEIARLEQRIVTDSGTVTSLLHSLAKLDLRDHRSLMASMADTIRSFVGTNSFSIYLRSARGLEPCFGITEGSAIGATAVPPLPELLLEDIDRACASGTLSVTSPPVAGAPLWAPIRLAGAVESVGVVVCMGLQPLQTPSTARRRLEAVCHILAALLVPLREPVASA